MGNGGPVTAILTMNVLSSLGVKSAYTVLSLRDAPTRMNTFPSLLSPTYTKQQTLVIELEY